MFKKMKLGLKISVGFGLLILLAMGLGGFATWQMNRVSGTSQNLAANLVPEVAVGNSLYRASLWTMFEMRGYVYTKDKKFLEDSQKRLGETKQALADARNLPHFASDGLLQEKITKAEEAIKRYEVMVKETVTRSEAIFKARTDLDDAAKKYMRGCFSFLEDQNQAMSEEVKLYSDAATIEQRHLKITLVNDILDMGNQIQITTAKAEARNDPGFITAAMSGFPDIEQKLAELKPITKKKENQAHIAQVGAAGKAYQAAMRDLLSNWLGLEKLNKERNQIANEVLAVAQEAADTALKECDALAVESAGGLDSAGLATLAGLAAALLVGVALAVFITLSVTRPIHNVIAGMGEGAEQVASAAGQVNNASQQLAQGSAQQAAALEETSSALEEMASMTRTNADNASQADRLMADTRQVVERANNSMSQLTGSMAEINQASQQTSQIIKTIDEIAFQTNLLALNAAVEAARAGEAGAGFAVVAGEVRNLSMRAAEAAKNTTDLIEQTLRKVKTGADLVERTNIDFNEVAASSVKVAELVGEIAAASKEQAQGIDQVNRATNEMDKVTQQNAANAQESAAAAEELSAQAETMQSFVDDLVRLVGSAKERGRHRRAALPSGGGEPDLSEPDEPAPERPAPPLKLAQAPGKPALNPAREFPLDDDDFQNF